MMHTQTHDDAHMYLSITHTHDACVAHDTHTHITLQMFLKLSSSSLNMKNNKAVAKHNWVLSL